MYLWRAVDDEGEALDRIVQRRRDNEAALKLLGRLLRNQPVEPERITTEGLGLNAWSRILWGGWRCWQSNANLSPVEGVEAEG